MGTLSQYILNLQEEKKQRKINGMKQVLPYINEIYNQKNQEYLSKLAVQESETKRRQALEDYENKEIIKENTKLKFSPLHNQQNIANKKNEISELQPLKDQNAIDFAINKGKAERIAFTEVDNQNEFNKYQFKKEIDAHNRNITEQEKEKTKQEDESNQYKHNLHILNNSKIGRIGGVDKIIYNNIPYDKNSEIAKAHQNALLKKKEFEIKYPTESAKLFLENNDRITEYDYVNKYNLTNNTLIDKKTKKKIKDRDILNEYNKTKEKTLEYDAKFKKFLEYEINIGNIKHTINDFYNEFEKRNLHIKEYKLNFNQLNTQQKYNAIITRLPPAGVK